MLYSMTLASHQMARKTNPSTPQVLKQQFQKAVTARPTRRPPSHSCHKKTSSSNIGDMGASWNSMSETPSTKILSKLKTKSAYKISEKTMSESNEKHARLRNETAPRLTKSS
jgi:hypothetical protein